MNAEQPCFLGVVAAIIRIPNMGHGQTQTTTGTIMSINRVIGAVILVIGLGLLISGYNASESAADQLSETFLGNYTDETVWYLIAGAAATVGGIP